MSPSFDPTTRLFFVTARETCATYFGYEQTYQARRAVHGGGTQRPRDQKNFGALRAIDPATATVKWEFRYTSTSASGVLTTASGLVVCRRRRRQPDGVRIAHREEPLALSARVPDALDLRDDLHGRRPPVSARAGGQRADRVRAAAAVIGAPATRWKQPLGPQSARRFQKQSPRTLRPPRLLLSTQAARSTVAGAQAPDRRRRRGVRISSALTIARRLLGAPLQREARKLRGARQPASRSVCVIRGPGRTPVVAYAIIRDDKPITELATRVVRGDGTLVLEGTAVCYTFALE